MGRKVKIFCVKKERKSCTESGQIFMNKVL